MVALVVTPSPSSPSTSSSFARRLGVPPGETRRSWLKAEEGVWVEEEEEGRWVSRRGLANGELLAVDEAEEGADVNAGWGGWDEGSGGC